MSTKENPRAGDAGAQGFESSNDGREPTSIIAESKAPSTPSIEDIVHAMKALRRFCAEPNVDRDSFKYWRRTRELNLEITPIQDAVARRFAELNGWKLSRREFVPELIGTRRYGTYGVEWGVGNDLADHCLYFRADKTNTAILTQPYLKVAEIERFRAWTDHLGLALHLPPDPYASFWFPGYATFVVLTVAGGEVRWLPEQDGRLAALWRRGAS
jgi:hypothetical protein